MQEKNDKNIKTTFINCFINELSKKKEPTNFVENYILFMSCYQYFEINN